MQNNITRIRIDNSIYRLEVFGDSFNIMIWLDGEYVSPDSTASYPDVEHIDQCCIFSHVLDMLAYIMLLRHEDKICHNNRPTCYLVIKPSTNYSLVYELLKRYRKVHGYLRVCKESKAINNMLEDLLEVTYLNETSHYCKYESLFNYCMDKYKYIEL